MISEEDVQRSFDEGSLVPLVFRLYPKDEEETRLVEALVELHNSGKIDVFTIAPSPSFSELEPHDFFVGQHLLGKVIPRLQAPSRKMMALVSALVAKAGEDLAANQPNGSLREWLTANPDKASEIIEGAKADDPLCADHLTFALTAINAIDEAYYFATQVDDRRQLSGITALSRIEMNVECRNATLEVLGGVTDKDPDDPTRQNLLAAVLKVAFDDPSAPKERWLPTLEKLCSEAGPHTRYQASQALWTYAKSLDVDSFGVLSRCIGTLLPEELGTARQVDVGIRSLLDTGLAAPALELLRKLIADKRLTLGRNSSLTHELSRSHPQMFCRLVIGWLGDGDPNLCLSLRAFLPDDGPLDVSEASIELTDVQRYFVARKAIGYAPLPVVICICFGGDIREQVQPMVAGYIDDNSTDRISYDIWNGDKLAGMVEAGLLREKVLPPALQSRLRKAVALVDEPDVSFRHFTKLVREISESAKKSKTARVRAVRQIYVCLWMLFVWSRDADNVEAAYLASELSILRIWELGRDLLPRNNAESRALDRVLGQTIKLHLTISGEFLDKKVFPTVGVLHATSMAIDTRSAVDVNLKLFDVLGRIAMAGLWLGWTVRRSGREASGPMKIILTKAMELVQNNPALSHPLRDDHAIDLNLILLLSLQSGELHNEVGSWFSRVIENIDFSYRGERNYPCVFTDYRDLLFHPKKGDEEYFKDATSGSILIPLLAAWAAGVRHADAFETLVKLKSEVLRHCTLQAWLPADDTEDSIYIGETDHGFCLSDLPVEGDGSALLQALEEACKRDEALESLSAVKLDVWPMVLVACRHYRLPVPPPILDRRVYSPC